MQAFEGWASSLSKVDHVVGVAEETRRDIRVHVQQPWYMYPKPRPKIQSHHQSRVSSPIAPRRLTHPSSYTATSPSSFPLVSSKTTFSSVNATHRVAENHGDKVARSGWGMEQSPRAARYTPPDPHAGVCISTIDESSAPRPPQPTPPIRHRVCWHVVSPIALARMSHQIPPTD